MATRIKIKRSSANPTATPSSVLGQGELAYAEGTSTYTDAQSATVTSYGKPVSYTHLTLPTKRIV